MFTPSRPHGPLFRSKLDLMGIRFLEGDGSEGDGGGGGGEPKPFEAITSQDDFDKRIQSRLAREREKYADYDELKQAKSKYDEHLESQKTDHEKAIESARGEASTEVTQKFLSKLVGSEVKALASTLGFNDPSDALQVLGSDLPVKDDEPDTDAIKALVEKLATDKPYLLKGDAPRPPRQRPTPKKGEKAETTGEAGKGRAASALRQLSAARKNE
jgi:hypothetical protein